MGHEVPRIPTPVTAAEAALLIGAACVARIGSPPSRRLAEFVLALAWVETNRGQSIYWHNAGNVSCFAPVDRNWSGNYWRPTWWSEDFPAEHQFEGKPAAFRAYDDAVDGWGDFVREVVRRGSVVRAAESNDAVAFVQALHDSNYSRDYVAAKHAKTFRTLVDEFRQVGLFAHLTDVSSGRSGSAGGIGVGMALVTVLAACGVGWVWAKAMR